MGTPQWGLRSLHCKMETVGNAAGKDAHHSIYCDGITVSTEERLNKKHNAWYPVRVQ